MAFDPMKVLTSSLPSKSGQAAFGRMQDSTGLGSIQNAWQSFQQGAPQPMQPPTSIPQPPQEPAPAPQAAAAGAVSQFEQMVEAARPQGWPAVDNVYKQQLTNLWQSGENKAAYDVLHRRYIEEEGRAAAAGVSGQTV